MVVLLIGETTSIKANEVYALPFVPALLSSPGAIQTSILAAGPFTTISNGLVNGCFLKSAADTTVKLDRYIL